MPEPQDQPATVSDEDIETRLVTGAADPGAGDDTGDDGDSGDDTGDTSDTSDTGDDSGDA